MTSPDTIPARVLVVDDDPDLRHVLSLALEDEGYEVRTVADGQTALNLLEEWQPRLILLDLMMPNLDGWSFRQRQWALKRGHEIPVVVLSAARDAAVDSIRPAAFVPKPFNLDRLLELVARLVR